MKLHLWGTDFRRSSPELRQRLFCEPAERLSFLRELVALGMRDVVYLSTCNRVEFYTTCEDYFTDSRPLWLSVLAARGLDREDYYSGYQLEGKSAVRHLMRVACSLESLVVGEPQILGQLKEALRFTQENGLPLSASLSRVFTLAFETAKRVRTETAIGSKPVSVASLGLQHLLAMEEAYPLRRAVVVGRGPISVLIVQWLKAKRPTCPILWVNRTPAAITELPESRGVEVLSLDEFRKSPPAFTHLFSATSSHEPIFRRDFFLRSGGGSLVFDFAQPPDVERDAGDLVKIVGLEDLKQEAKENEAARAQAIQEAERMIDLAIRDYCQQQKEAPLLRDFTAIEPVFFEELTVACEAIRGELPQEFVPRVNRWAERLVKRNLHHSREHLRHVLRQVSDPDDSARLM